MSLLYQNAPARICPSCKVVLPPILKQVSCYNCGYQLTEGQTGGDISDKPAQPLAVARKQNQSSSTRIGTAFIYLISVLLISLLYATGIRAGIFLPILQTASVTPVHKLAYPIPNRAPLFADTFVNDSSGWNLQGDAGNYAVTVGNGTLNLEDDNHTLLWALLPGERSYGDFILTVNAVLSKGDQNNGYGIYIRGSSKPNTDLAAYYRFELYGDASYAIFKGTVDQSGKSTATKIMNYTLHPAIQKKGGINHIMIIAKGSTMSLIVNDQKVKTFSDPDYTNGSIALFVSNLSEAKPNAQAQFSQFAIYPV